jgi:hypothetical protein
VIEIEPADCEIIWSYEETPPIAFFSPISSNAQRLSNGNTLINEGATGRLFEVTAEGEVVWEYINPYFCGPTARDQQNAVFRAYRYPLDRVAMGRFPCANQENAPPRAVGGRHSRRTGLSQTMRRSSPAPPASPDAQPASEMGEGRAAGALRSVQGYPSIEFGVAAPDRGGRRRAGVPATVCRAR